MIKRIHNFLGKQLKVLHLPLALYFSLLSLSRVVSAPPPPPRPKCIKPERRKMPDKLPEHNYPVWLRAD
jgi:hypothetical protein